MTDHPEPGPAGAPGRVPQSGPATHDSSAGLPAIRDAAELAVLAELGREVSSVLDLDELLEKIPQLISRLTSFTVFSVYLLDEQRAGPEHRLRRRLPRGDRQALPRCRSGQGIVGAAVAEQRPILLNDVDSDPRYLAVVPGVASQLAVPLRNKGKVIGALNLLSDRLGAFTERDESILRQFGAHVAQAHRQRAAVRVGARVRRDARDAGGDRARDERHPRSRRAADAARAPDQAGHRLPHLRHRAARRVERRCSR